MIVCPQCGAQLDDQHTVCPICKNDVLIHIRRRKRKDAVSVPPISPAKMVRVPVQPDNQGFVHMALSDCRACGSEMRYNEKRRLFVCDYCGSLAVPTAPSEWSHKPAKNIPTYEEVDFVPTPPPQGEAIAFVPAKAKPEPKNIPDGSSLSDYQAALTPTYTENYLKSLQVPDAEILPPQYLPLLNDAKFAEDCFHQWHGFQKMNFNRFNHPKIKLKNVSSLYFPVYSHNAEMDSTVTLDLSSANMTSYLHDHFQPANKALPSYANLNSRHSFNASYGEPFDRWERSSCTLLDPELVPEIAERVSISQLIRYVIQHWQEAGSYYSFDVKVTNFTQRLLYLPVWQVNFTAKGREESLWLSGQTGNELASTFDAMTPNATLKERFFAWLE